MVAIMVFMGLTPDLASQLWMSLLVAGGFAVAFALRRLKTAS
jgi:GABA permease